MFVNVRSSVSLEILSLRCIVMQGLVQDGRLWRHRFCPNQTGVFPVCLSIGVKGALGRACAAAGVGEKAEDV